MPIVYVRRYAKCRTLFIVLTSASVILTISLHLTTVDDQRTARVYRFSTGDLASSRRPESSGAVIGIGIGTGASTVPPRYHQATRLSVHRQSLQVRLRRSLDTVSLTTRTSLDDGTKVVGIKWCCWLINLSTLSLVIQINRSHHIEPPRLYNCNETRQIEQTIKMKLSVLALIATATLIEVAVAGPIAGGLCYTACNAGYVLCVTSAGSVAGKSSPA